MAAIRARDESRHALWQRQHRQRHVLHRRPNECDHIVVAAEDEVLEVRLNRSHRCHRWIERRAQTEEQQDRPLEEHPILRHLKSLCQLTKGHIELSQIGEHLGLGANVDLNILEAERLERHLLEEAALEVLDDALGDSLLIRCATILLDAGDEAHSPQRARDLRRLALDHALEELGNPLLHVASSTRATKPIRRSAPVIFGGSRLITPSRNWGIPSFMSRDSSPTAPKSTKTMLPSSRTRMFPGCGSA